MGHFNPDEHRLIAFTGVAHGITHYLELIFPTLAVSLAVQEGIPLERVLGWSLVGYLLFGLGALPAGLTADRFGARRCILAGLIGAGAATLMAAFARPGWQLGACLAALLLAASIYHPAGLGMLSRSVRERGRALGLNGIYGNLGMIAAPLSTAWLAQTFGWRSALATSGFAVLAAALVFARMEIQEATRIVREQDSLRGSSLNATAIGAFALLCMASIMGGIVYRGNSLAAPGLFEERVTLIGYGTATSLALVLGIAGQYLGGALADRYDLKRLYFAFHLISLPMIFGITQLFGFPLVVAAGLYAFFAFGMQPIENSLFAAITPDRWLATAYGLKFALVFGIGSLAVGLVRVIGERDGLVGVYTALSAVVVLLLASILALIVWTRRERYHAGPAEASVGP